MNTCFTLHRIKCRGSTNELQLVSICTDQHAHRFQIKGCVTTVLKRHRHTGIQASITLQCVAIFYLLAIDFNIPNCFSPVKLLYLKSGHFERDLHTNGITVQSYLLS